MIPIDSDTHFTPPDAFGDLVPKYFDQGPRLVELLSGRCRIDYPARAQTQRRPKDCFDNFYFSFGSEDSTLPDVVRRFGSSRLMIGRDYPHPDGTSPNTISMLKARQGLPPRTLTIYWAAPLPNFLALKCVCNA